MRRLHLITDAAGIDVAAAQSTLPYPPTSFAIIPASWRTSNAGVVPVLNLTVWSSTTSALSSATLYGGILHDFAIADDDVDTVDFANDELDLTSHAYETGDGPLQLSTTSALPSGITAATDYFVIKVSANTIQLAETFDDALAGTAIAIADAGTGTHTIEDTSETSRMYWHNFGPLGFDDDGAIALTASAAQLERIEHNPLVRAYAMTATIDTGDISATIYPIIER